MFGGNLVKIKYKNRFSGLDLELEKFPKSCILYDFKLKHLKDRVVWMGCKPNRRPSGLFCQTLVSSLFISFSLIKYKIETFYSYGQKYGLFCKIFKIISCTYIHGSFMWCGFSQIGSVVLTLNLKIINYFYRTKM